MRLNATNDKLEPIIIFVWPPQGPQWAPADLGVEQSEGCWEVSRWPLRARVCVYMHAIKALGEEKKWEDEASGAPVTVKVWGSEATAASSLIFPFP